MKIELCKVVGQVYLLPYIKVTHTRWINSYYELIIGFWNIELVIRYE